MGKEAFFDSLLLLFIVFPVLYQLGFMPAMEWIADRMREKNGIEIESVADQEQGEIKGEIRAFLYKTVRELVMNIVKHTRATKSMISVSSDKDHIKIAVEDDGAGFSVSYLENESVENSSFGIF
jgi:signal transduction histidine kinase